MTWDVTPEPLRFAEAVAWFRLRVPMSDDEFYELEADARQRAFTVRAVADLDMVAAVHESLELALATGVDFGEWRATMREALEREWGGSVADPGNRLETIFRTNVQGAYGAGRYEQLTAPAVAQARPYWMYDAILDARTTEGCSELNGTIRPASDPWWNNRIPPRHFRCRSGLRSLREDQARRRGITDLPPMIEPEDGFGHPPGEREWAPMPSDYPPELWAAYQARVAANG
jgi:SPP1 gp7 family putative phage head morphogenesis protein